MVNRPIVAHLRPPLKPIIFAATIRRVLARSHQRCSPVQVASDLGHERRRRGTGEMSGFFFASFKTLS